VNSRVQKWGNSLALRIPHAFAVEVGLAENSEVELSMEDGRLVVQPVVRMKYDLAELLSKVTPQNRHAEVDWGAPVGKEAW
jgi:antitoxin MazE